jgi:hypothetical protein
LTHAQLHALEFIVTRWAELPDGCRGSYPSEHRRTVRRAREALAELRAALIPQPAEVSPYRYDAP